MIRQTIKFILHHILCPVLLFSAMDRFFRLFSNNRRLIIMYHGVRKTGQRINGRHITDKQFERQLQYFKRHFNIISLQEICSMKKQDIAPDRHTIALTFDDGFLNNVTVALPLLERYNIPATFFICGAPLEDKDYLHPTDLIDLIRISSSGSFFKIGEETFAVCKGQLKNVYNRLTAYQHINSLRWNELSSLLKKLREDHKMEKITDPVDDELYSLIDEKSILEVTGHDLVTIGSHSLHHVNLKQLYPEEVDHELKHSKDILEKHCKTTVSLIAFPYGSYDAYVIESARKNGYQFMIAGGDVPQEFSKQVFPRIGVLDGTSFSYAILSINRGFNRFGF